MGERLRYALKQRGWTQNKLADRIGVEPNMISRYVNELNTPGANVIIAICEALEISADWLLLGKGEFKKTTWKRIQ